MKRAWITIGIVAAAACTSPVADAPPDATRAVDGAASGDATGDAAGDTLSAIETCFPPTAGKPHPSYDQFHPIGRSHFANGDAAA